MSVLVLAEMTDAGLNRDATARAVGALHTLGEITVLCAGPQAQAAATEAAGIAGVTRVLVTEEARYAHQLAEPMAALVVSLAADYTHIAAAATSAAKNILPRAAALLDVMLIAEVSRVIDGDTFERPIYAGNAVQTVKSRDPVKVMTVRTASFKAAGAGGTASVVKLEAAADSPALSAWLSDQVAHSERPELTSARRVVSGGRGVGSKAQFTLIEALADKLGAAVGASRAAVGASRAAVDAGYAPNDWQVGQTGKVVAPELYVAVGISGVIQHLAGMKDSRVIVAINRDEDAPIFQIADYALVGDLFEILPELIQAL